MAELTDPELEALGDAITETERDRSWGNLEELIATLVDVNTRMLVRLEAGIATVQPKKLGDAKYPDPIERPAHVVEARESQQSEAEQETREVSLHDLFAMFGGPE